MRKIEHIGIAVKSLKESNLLFEKLFGQPPYKEEEVASEGVKTSFFMNGPNKIELLEATNPDSPIAKFLEKKGEGIHHIAFDVEDIEAESANGRGRRPYNPHRPLFHHCRTAKISDHETVFRINHYLGSWEAFSFRDDPRKGGKRTSRDGWEFLSQSATEGPNDWLRPWLVGFVQTVGIELASELLKDSGLEQNYTTAINMSLWMFNNKKEGI